VHVYIGPDDDETVHEYLFLNKEGPPGGNGEVYFRDPYIVPGVRVEGVATVKDGVMELYTPLSQGDMHTFGVECVTAAGFFVDEVPEAVLATINEEEPKQANAHQQEKCREEKR
jgi:hypothetical protein